MALDPYATCPCGSGKKYRWCCEPIDRDLRRALSQEENGQHDAALRIIDEVITAHPGNPRGHAQKAELLFKLARVEEAEAALEKAFAINPNYPYGLLLRAIFRFREGEIPGALLLARRAAEAYDTQAHDYLAETYALIFDCEMALNRPVAGREALRRAVHHAPADEGLRERFEAIFGDKSRLPASARRDYRTVAPPPAGDPAHRAARAKVADDAESGRLGELVAALEELTTEAADDRVAWFYLGLARAWLGDNTRALDALDRYLQHEPDDERATAAAALQEVLRCGRGLEDVGDYSEYLFILQLREGMGIEALLQDWAQSHRLIPLQSGQDGTFVGLLVETSATGLITAGRPAADAGRFAGYLLIAGNMLRVNSPLKEPFDRLKDEVRQRLGLGLTDLKEARGPIQFTDVLAEALLFPFGSDEAKTSERLRQHMERYFEETWIHKPRKVLAGNAPVDAVGHTVLRRKLLGVIRFIEDCSVRDEKSSYDFGRLRRKLGLTAVAEKGALAAAAAGIAAATDPGAMGAAELAGLSPETLDTTQLEQSWHAAQKLDAVELAVRFAKALASRPVDPARADRYPVYSYLAQRALQEGDPGRALDWVNEGQKTDCETNEGRRRNDYELRRGQVHTKRGEADAAHEVYQRLIERAPGEMRFRTAAAEAMLSLRQGARARAIAEAGLETARKQGDRDAAGHLEELLAAAKKQTS